MKGSRTREPCHPFAVLRAGSERSEGSARAKPLCAHPDRPFASLTVTSDPRVFPVLVGKIHDRPLGCPIILSTFIISPCLSSPGFAPDNIRPTPDRPFAPLRVTSDPRVFPVLLGTNHNRQWAAINRPLGCPIILSTSIISLCLSSPGFAPDNIHPAPELPLAQ
jgi:hypothetical protein